MRKKRVRGHRSGAVLRRTAALFMAGSAVWLLWLTVDLRPAGQALRGLGEDTELAATLLAAELGKPARDGPLTGMTGWERLLLGQSAVLTAGLVELPPEESPAPSEAPSPAPTSASPSPAPAPEGSPSQPPTTQAPDNIVEQTLAGSDTPAYLSTEGVYVRNYTQYEVDLNTLVAPSVTLSDTDEPQILILHTHTTEAYTMDGTDIYAPTGEARTIDTYYNVVRVGEEIAKVLRRAGFGVIHDTELYDYPNYNGAYQRSAQSAREWLEKYPSISVILDVHRDALASADGTVYKTAAEINGEKTAQCMLVVGTDDSLGSPGGWQENLAFAVQIESRLNEDWPTLARPIALRPTRFNQELSPASMLVEVGSHGNTLQESLAAGRYFASSLAKLLEGLQ